MLLAQEDEAVWQMRRIDKGLNFFLGTVVMASLIVLFGVVAHQVLIRFDRLSSTLLLFLMAFALSAIFMLYQAARKRRAEYERIIKPENLPQTRRVAELLPEPTYLGTTSVAERTTELLEVKKGGNAKGE